VVKPPAPEVPSAVVGEVLGAAIDAYCADPRGMAEIARTDGATHYVELRLLATAEAIARGGALGAGLHYPMGVTVRAYGELPLRGTLATSMETIRRSGSVAIMAATLCESQQRTRGTRLVPLEKAGKA
jgi:hypothetical protein